VIPLGANDETGALLGALLVCKDKFHQDNVARLKLVMRRVLWVVPKIRQDRISTLVEGDRVGN
jgi:hypothetical protein